MRFKTSHHVKAGWAAALVLILLLTITSASAFVTPKPSRLTPSKLHLQLPSPSARVIRENLNDCRKRTVPPIPVQEENLGFVKQFRPRFVAREFLLGVRTMCQIYPLLMIGSMAMHVLRIGLLNTVDAVPSQLKILEQTQATTGAVLSPLHTAEVRSKLFICQNLGLSISSPVLCLAIGPVVEEFFYRGVGQWSATLLAQLYLCFVATSCGWFTPKVTLAWIGFDFVSDFVSSMMSKSSCGFVQFMASSIVRTVPTAILLPAILATAAQFKKTRSAETRRTIDKDDNEKEGHVETGPAGSKLGTRRRGVVSRLFHKSISKSIYKNTGSAPSDDIWPVIDSAISRFARLIGAWYFGKAHFCFAPPEAAAWTTNMILMRNSIKIQKLFGTMISSLLVESRLVVKRRTLWGAFGAHIAFNVLADAFPLTRLVLLHACGAFEGISNLFFYVTVAMLFWGMQWIWRTIAGVCEKMEHNLSVEDNVAGIENI